MRAFEHSRNLAGFLSLLAMLILASPGVEAVRADPAGGQAAAPAGQCPATQRAAAADAELSAFIVELRREHAAPGGAPRSDVVVLNNRGYNYGSPPGIDFRQIRADAAGARRH
jgi:hypothetical protein